MGGDYAPQETVAGALLAAKEGIPVVLVGQTPAVKAELQQQGGDLPIVEAPEHIAMEDAATDVRKKRGSSINVCMELVKKGEAYAVVAMGHTGATLASALFNIQSGTHPGR